MKKSGVVFLAITENTKITIENVTSLQVCNKGKTNVTVNGISFSDSTETNNDFKTLVIADGTVSTIDLDIEFISNGNPKKLQIIYKKIIGCEN